MSSDFVVSKTDVAVAVTDSTVAFSGTDNNPELEIVIPSASASASTSHVTTSEALPVLTTVAESCKVEPLLTDVAPPVADTVTLVIDGSVALATVIVAVAVTLES